MAQILIVDDATSIRNIISTILKSQGHKVTDAADGKTALEKAKRITFDVVITDLHMPMMNGIELIKNLRSVPAYKYTPLLLLTTDSSQARKSEGKNAGATGWMQKPFKPEKLLATVNRVLG